MSAVKPPEAVLLRAREAAASVFDDDDQPTLAAAIRAGREDHISQVQAVIAALSVRADIYARMVAHVQVTQLLRTYEHEKAMAVSEGYPAADKARNAFICAVCDLIAPAEEPVPCTRS